MSGPRPGKILAGFTLIELLVVVAILVLLAGLLLPQLGRARQRGQAMACVNNLRQLGVAIQMYWDDNNGQLNGLYDTFPNWGDTAWPHAWSFSIYPYLNTTRVFLDPGRPNWMRAPIVHYYLNLLPAFAAASNQAAGPYPVDSRLIKNPSAFIVLSDDLWEVPLPEIDPSNEVTDRTGFDNPSADYPPFHLGTANFLFADGHVAAFSRFDTGQMTYWYNAMANWQATTPR